MKKKEKKEEKQKKIVKVVAYIDGENVSHKKAEQILSYINSGGKAETKAYTLDKNKHGWDKEVEKYSISYVRLPGQPEKNKVDNRIKSDALNRVAWDANINTVFFVTSDHGYANVIKRIREFGKKVVVIGNEGKTALKLREACSRYIAV